MCCKVVATSTLHLLVSLCQLRHSLAADCFRLAGNGWLATLYKIRGSTRTHMHDVARTLRHARCTGPVTTKHWGRAMEYRSYQPSWFCRIYSVFSRSCFNVVNSSALFSPIFEKLPLATNWQQLISLEKPNRRRVNNMPLEAREGLQKLLALFDVRTFYGLIAMPT